METWDRPPNFTTMHRRGIARVVGDKFILDGTTIDEVKDTHAATVKLVVDKVNHDAKVVEETRRRKEQDEKAEADRHRKNVEDVARDIEF